MRFVSTMGFNLNILSSELYKAGKFCSVRPLGYIERFPYLQFTDVC